ncbi:unnamed protein product [Durusdinium trenchii]|uniref:Uroporphyrinogen-III synthase n=1 Tax=Durusdinium trenchii TaxID=1381693 RepID=A0ABP0KVL0_9DINO
MMGHPCRAGRWMPLLGILLCILGSRTGRPRYTALVSVALTRQAGENVKLQKALEQALAEAQLKAQLVEVPCIEHAAGPDLQELEALLSSKTEVEEVVLLTSPEAARVFGEAWRAARSPTCRVASVGKGTSVAAAAFGLEVIFEPSKANAETLAVELPSALGPKLWYAASAIAPGTLQEGLEQRGFQVTRLNTYTTQPLLRPTPEALALMEETSIATFGSPSAVRAWSKVTPHRPLCACIGRRLHPHLCSREARDFWLGRGHSDGGEVVGR